MGRGSYTAKDWLALRSSKGLNEEIKTEQVFVEQAAFSCYNSAQVSFRESFDSFDSPSSTPIMIGFDVTASMGYLAKELAVNSINRTVMSLYENKPISDPHILCAAIGDCKSDRYPLQVTQFEADIRIIEQLTKLYIESGGGGNGGESYNLLWYFAAKHTKIDSYDKRGKKGYIFTVGDDYCHDNITVAEIRRVFGDIVEYTLSNEELISMASERFNVFHIHIGSHTSDTFKAWNHLMPGRCTCIDKENIRLFGELVWRIISKNERLPLCLEADGLYGEDANILLKSLSHIEIKNEIREILSF